MELALGIDVGTTMAKAALFDLAAPAKPVAVAEARSPHVNPEPGHMEADPVGVLDAVVLCARRAREAHPAGRVVALGISGTACGAWLVDAAGAPVRSAILWNDGRAASVTSQWAADGRLDEVFAISGNVPFPGYTLPLLRWLRLHEPESLDRAAAVLTPKDWLRLQLTGERLTDDSDASYIPADIRTRAWSPRLHEICEVAEDAQRLLPPIAEPLHTAPLLREWAERMGLEPGTPMALGLTDVVAATAGGGAVRPGRAVTSLGTSAVSTIVTDTPVLEPHRVGLTACAPNGRWMRTMVNTSGSMTLDWAARLITGGDVGELIARAERARPDADGAVLLPYLSPAGVVSPFVAPAARGVLAGLRVEHGPNEVARAAVEGLACAVADCYAAMPVAIEAIDVVGGAARSDLLVQAIADRTGSPVRRLDGEAFGCRSVALVAARAAGALATDADLDAALEDVEVARSFTPDAAAGAETMRRYRAASAATRELWPDWEPAA